MIFIQERLHTAMLDLALTMRPNCAAPWGSEVPSETSATAGVAPAVRSAGDDSRSKELLMNCLRFGASNAKSSLGEAECEPLISFWHANRGEDVNDIP